MTDVATALHPTLDEIWAGRSAPKAFPVALVEGATTAASFFSASFYGRNDVIYLDHLKVPDIVLVDTDRGKLAVMAKLYPTVMEAFAEDAFAVAARLRDKGRIFDVVICDPYDNVSAKVLVDHFETFAALARRHWVTGVSLDTLAAHGVPPTLDGVQAWLDGRGQGAWEAVWLEVRNHKTGLAWLGLHRRAPAGPASVPSPAPPTRAEQARAEQVPAQPSPASAAVDAPPDDPAATEPAPDRAAAAAADGSMWSLIDGGIRSYLVRAFVELDLADRLDGGPRDVATLADEVGAPIDTLRRFLRAAQTIGLCALDPNGQVALAPVGTTLRRSDPRSMAAWTLLTTSRWFVRPWERLAEAVRTGRATFPGEFGAGMWEYMAAHPEFAAAFDGAMTGSAAELADSLLAAADLSSARTIVDLGGGEGKLVASLLARLPQARGIVADRAEVLAGAPEVLAAAGVGDRVQLVPTDFRQRVPDGGDVYILSRIIHDWPDAEALEILSACRRSMPPTARLYLIEMVVPPDAHVPPDARYDHTARDLLMLVLMGGKERNLAEYRQLLVEAGFGDVRLLGERGIVIEAVPYAGNSAPPVPQAFPTPLVSNARSVAAFLPETERAPLAAVPEVDPAVVEIVAGNEFEAASRLHEQGRTFDVVLCDPADAAAEQVLVEHFDTFSSLARNVWVTSIRQATLERIGIDPSLVGVQVWLDSTNRWDWEAAWLEVGDPGTGLVWLALRRQAEEDKRAERPDLAELGRDGGTGLTVEHIWQARTSPAAFPRPLVSGARSAASFFSAMFYGRNDVVFLHRYGVSEILINDIDEEKLAVMARVYPSVTEVVAGDAFAAAERLVQQGRVFDVVVCDSFDAWKVLDEYFDTFAALARRAFLTGETVPELRAKGIEPTLAGIQAYLDAKGRHDWQITWLQARRENTNIGALWMGFERRRVDGRQPDGPLGER